MIDFHPTGSSKVRRMWRPSPKRSALKCIAPIPLHLSLLLSKPSILQLSNLSTRDSIALEPQFSLVVAVHNGRQARFAREGGCLQSSSRCNPPSPRPEEYKTAIPGNFVHPISLLRFLSSPKKSTGNRTEPIPIPFFDHRRASKAPQQPSGIPSGWIEAMCPH